MLPQRSSIPPGGHPHVPQHSMSPIMSQKATCVIEWGSLEFMQVMAICICDMEMASNIFHCELANITEAHRCAIFSLFFTLTKTQLSTYIYATE